MRASIFGAVALAVAATAVLSLIADEKPDPNEVRVIIKSVDAEKGTLLARGARDGDTGERTYNLDRGVKVLVEGKEVKLADVRVGSIVNLKLAPASGDVVGIQIVAVGRGEGERRPGEGERRPDGERRPGEGERRPDGERRAGPTVRALVRSVDAAKNTLTATIAEREGEVIEDRTLELAPEAKILIDGKEKKLADLAAGTVAFVQLSADRKSIVNLRAEGPMLRGRVKAVDAEKNSITLAANDAGEERTYTLAPETKAYLREQVVRLDDVKPNSNVMLRLASDRKTVIAVTVFPGEREGANPERRPDQEKERER